MRKITAAQLRLIGITVGVLFAGYLLLRVVVGPLLILLAHSLSHS